MKRLLSLVLLMSTVNITKAQEAASKTYRNQFHISIGLLQKVIIDGTDEIPGMQMRDRDFTASPIGFKKGVSYTGPIVIGYRRAFGKNITAGINIAGAYYNDTKVPIPQRTEPSEGKTWYFGLTLEGTYQYWAKNKWSV